MSATVISFPTACESQEIFDKLVARAGISHEASAQEKLAALRSLTDEQMTAWLDGAVLIRPSWDPKWFSRLDGPSRLDQVKTLPDWVEGIVIGSTKDETANIRPFWQPFPSETILNAVKSVVPNQDMSDEVATAYGLTSSSHEEVLSGLLDLTTESFFGLFPQALGELRAPISVYRFEQPDTFERSIYRYKAYHCLDLPFLFRMPAVASPDADAAMRSTADFLTDAIATFVNGEQPWDPFHTSHKMMVFRGRDSGLRQWPDNERWRKFFTTPDQSSVLVDTGRLVMTYNLGQLGKDGSKG
jgi:carboxylesterase type B